MDSGTDVIRNEKGKEAGKARRASTLTPSAPPACPAQTNLGMSGLTENLPPRSRSLEVLLLRPRRQVRQTRGDSAGGGASREIPAATLREPTALFADPKAPLSPLSNGTLDCFLEATRYHQDMAQMALGKGCCHFLAVKNRRFEG